MPEPCVTIAPIVAILEGPARSGNLTRIGVGRAQEGVEETLGA
jgi:hypothetical protein